MSDIELVIKISEQTYIHLLNGKKHWAPLMNAIKNGTLLPKGHGDLIDRGFVQDVFIDAEMRKDYEYLGIGDILPVIKADKAESEDTNDNYK